MKVLVGCPMRRRAWMLGDWLAAVDRAGTVAGVDLAYAFVLGSDDTETAEALGELSGLAIHTLAVDEPPRDDTRAWSFARYEHMVGLRNQLLGVVRDEAPDLFWSVDSDMVVHRNSLVLGMDALVARDWDAVGMRAYLSKVGVACPTWGQWRPTSGLHRVDANGLFPVDVIMAIKLMTPAAYAIDYRFHHHGEDLGWSLAAREAGCRLGWDGRTVSKHVMDRSQLHTLDPRCGY